MRPQPWDSPGKNTGVGCHFLLQCIKVKSESEVAQPCPTLRNTMDCSLPGSSVHGIFQARVLEWGAIAFSGKRHLVFSKCIYFIIPLVWFKQIEIGFGQWLNSVIPPAFTLKMHTWRLWRVRGSGILFFQEWGFLLEQQFSNILVRGSICTLKMIKKHK